MPKPPLGAVSGFKPHGDPKDPRTAVPVPAPLGPNPDLVAAVPTPPPPPVQVQATLVRYIVHEEDDGASGRGVDLYMGFIASARDTSSGTTPVTGHMTKNNGGRPRNEHEVGQTLFSISLGENEPWGHCGIARLQLIESDQTSALVQQAFAEAKVPEFAKFKPEGLSDLRESDLPTFFLTPFGPIIRLLGESNTDDDYGHWNLTFARTSGGIRCSAYGGDEHCRANPSSVVVADPGLAQLSLSYVDGDNDIECVISLAASSDGDIAASLNRKKQEGRLGSA